ncbi:LemA family protein [Oscillibacter ruminantium]|uniref:LemA family protein n=1 Tax=Oscillibacter ruminantium TaxID=1263547 RepID=UPI0002D6E3A6|nr:LemA family protein [Oscillibacter ruminantium]MDN0031496.1 LemA family protein [Oscillibacter valericigenes]
MLPFIMTGAILVILVLWFISTQRALAMLDENINNAMSQIGVQLSSRWDALSALLDLTKGYAEHEYKTLSETIKARRPVTADSSAKDAAEQENLLIGAMSRIMAVAEQYPTLKADASYQKTMDSVNQYEGMVRQSRLIYNDSVTKLNRRIRMFPTSLVAGMLGFAKRDYLEANETKADMPSMK